MSEIKVLIADDQSLVRDGLSSLLSIQEGIEVVGVAENGQKALAAAQRARPDVVLMDIRMPVMDGIEALRRIRQIMPEVRVIMLTTFDDDEYIVKALKEGASGYLLKDIPTQDLVGAVIQAARGTFQADDGVIRKLSGFLSSETDNKKASDEEAAALASALDSLNVRERAIFRLLGRGYTNREIAGELNLSGGTVKNYMSNILAAFDLKDRTQAALLSYRLEDGKKTS